MTITAYLIIKKSGYKGSVRITKSSPALDYNEIAVRVNLDIPDELFSKPRLEATVKVPKDAVSAPVIEAEVIDNIQDLIKQSTGFEVRLNLVPVEEQS